MSNREVALRRGVSVDAVKFHVGNALHKLGLATRAELRFWDGVPVHSALRRTASGPAPIAVSGEISMPIETQLGTQLGPIGQIARHVSDLPAAAHWYGSVLGLPHLYTFEDLAFFDCGGTRLFLSPAEPGGVAAAQSLLYFRVGDIHATYELLRSRGVAFSGAPHLIHRHESGIEEWMAFFDDPDGQPLAIMAQTRLSSQAGAESPDTEPTG
jgi:catechol 2,3-dioxygenase-like lactoylglutathione lyase family enzyme